MNWCAFECVGFKSPSPPFSRQDCVWSFFLPSQIAVIEQISRNVKGFRWDMSTRRWYLTFWKTRFRKTMKNPQPHALKNIINRSPHSMGFSVKLYFVVPSKCDVRNQMYLPFLNGFLKFSFHWTIQKRENSLNRLHFAQQGSNQVNSTSDYKIEGKITSNVAPFKKNSIDIILTIDTVVNWN